MHYALVMNNCQHFSASELRRPFFTHLFSASTRICVDRLRIFLQDASRMPFRYDAALGDDLSVNDFNDWYNNEHGPKSAATALYFEWTSATGQPTGFEPDDGWPSRYA